MSPDYFPVTNAGRQPQALDGCLRESSVSQWQAKAIVCKAPKVQLATRAAALVRRARLLLETERELQVDSPIVGGST